MREKSSERPTLQTIADLTGLARTTVSRALGDAPDIAPNTKLRVRQVANEVGYRPDSAARSLRTGRTGNVTLLLPVLKTINNMTAVLIRELSQNFFRHGLRLNISPFFEDDPPIEPLRHVVNGGLADGVILNQTLPDDPRVRYLSEIGFPFATHGRTSFGIEHPYFDFNNLAFGTLAGKLLLKRGRRRILLILPPPEQVFGQDILKGVKSSTQGTDASVMRLEGCNGEDLAARIGQALRCHTDRHGFPDAIVTYSSGAAIEVMSFAREHDASIGKDFDLVAKDCEEFMSKTIPGLILARENIPRAAEFLCKALIRAIETPKAMPLQGIETPTELTEPRLAGALAQAPLDMPEQK